MPDITQPETPPRIIETPVDQATAVTAVQEIDLGDLLREIWRNRLIVAVPVILMAVVSAGAAFLLPELYLAEALIAPARNTQDNFSNAMSQFGNLASFGGLNLAKQEISNTDIAIETLVSRKFLTELIRKHDLLVPLFAGKGWEAENEKLILDPDIYDQERQVWVRKVPSHRTAKPSDLEAVEKFRDILSVTEGETTGFYRVSIEFISPRAAKEWVDWLISDLNETMRVEDVEHARLSIEYLRDQLRRTEISSIQNVFFSLLQKLTEDMMLAEVTPEYVLRTIDPAVEPEERSSPKRLLIIVFGIIAGAVIGFSIVISRFALLPK